MKEKKLTPNEQRFCLEYVANGRNGTRAYMSVYPRSSERAATTSAGRMLAKAVILAEIEKLSKVALDKLKASADDVLIELARMGMSDIGEATWKPGERDSAGNETVPGQLKPLYEMPLAFRRCISSIKRDKTGRIEIALWSKPAAANMLAKHHKIIEADVQVNVQLGFADRLRRAREKRLAKKK